MSVPIWLIALFLSGLLAGTAGYLLILILYLLYKLYENIAIKKDWIHPGFFLEFSLLVTTLANLKIVNIYDAGGMLADFKYARPEYFRESALVWALGNMVLLEAFDKKMRWVLPSLKWQFSGFRLLNGLFLVSIAVIFRRFWLKVGLPGAFDSLFGLIPLLGILMHARLSEYLQNRILFIKALILLALATGEAVMFAYLRTNMLIPGVVFFLGILSSAKNFRALSAPKFYPIYGLFFILSIFFTTFGSKRGELAVGFKRITELQAAKSIDVNSNERKGLSAFERSSNIAQLSAVSGLVHKNGLYVGAASQSLLTALIPRFLWPEKPKIALGVWFALEIGEALPTADGWYNTSINMTIPGHLFLDFGWVGLVLGCFFCGRFLRALWNTTHYQDSPLNLTGSLFACYLLYSSFLGLGADLQMFITFLAIYLLVLALDRVLKVRYG